MNSIRVHLDYSRGNWLYLACRRAGLDTRHIDAQLEWWETEPELYDTEQPWTLTEAELDALRLFLSRPIEPGSVAGLDGLREAVEGWQRRMEAAGL